jgi:MFS family permease
VLLVTLAIQPIRARLDCERDLSQKISVRTILAPENLRAPIQALRLSARIPPIVFASLCLAAAQGAIFAFMVTFLVIEIGLDLTSAGIMFSIVQVTSIVGRILLGGVADRLGSATATLCIITILSCITTAAFAFVTPDWSFGSLALLAAISGVTISSWNGLMLAEIAAIVPSGWVAQATSGTTMLVFIGYVVGPTVFSLLLDLSGSYTLAFVTISAFTALGAMVLVLAGLATRHGPVREEQRSI